MKDRCETLVMAVIKEIAEMEGVAALKNPEKGTKLLGATLDSLGIVLLSSELEEAIHREFKIEVSLADDRAMSQRTSPFRSVGRLAEYVAELASEKLAGQQ